MPDKEKSQLPGARFGRAHGPCIASVIFATLFIAMASSIGAAFADPPDMQNCQKDDEQSFAACTKIVEDNTTTPYDRIALTPRAKRIARCQTRL